MLSIETKGKFHASRFSLISDQLALIDRNKLEATKRKAKMMQERIEANRNEALRRKKAKEADNLGGNPIIMPLAASQGGNQEREFHQVGTPPIMPPAASQGKHKGKESFSVEAGKVSVAEEGAGKDSCSVEVGKASVPEEGVGK